MFIDLSELEVIPVESPSTPPSLLTKASNLSQALLTWHSAGKPMRSPDVIEAYHSVCLRCKFYKPTSNTLSNSIGECSKCGCRITNQLEVFNKIALATESCPIHKWPDTPFSEKPTGTKASGCCNGKDLGVIGGRLVARFDEHNLAPGLPGKRFNTSIIEDRARPGNYLLSYRHGWKGSEIFIVRLDNKFNPLHTPIQLNLYHQIEAGYGREDARLFYFNNQLHVAYIGVIGGSKANLHTSMLYARIDKELSVEEIYYPYYPKRNLWEKNWSFFEHTEYQYLTQTQPANPISSLYVIYSVSPHRILKIDGHRAEMAYETPTNFKWNGGEIRGGASPVLVGDEYWHFTHDRISRGRTKVYRTGLYTFESKPPFKITRYLPEPLLTSDPSTKPYDQWASVVFTCGAVKVGGTWVLSSGVHDRWTELTAVSHEELEDKLVTL